MVQLAGIQIPTAFDSLTTVRLLAPVARHARGTFSTDLGLTGTLSRDARPVFTTLRGRGALEPSRLRLVGFPLLARLSERLHIPALQGPALDPVRAALDVRDGRLHVSPFDVRLAGLRMRVAGSNGFDQWVDYTLRLEIPRGLLGAEAHQVLSGLLAKTDRVGLDLRTADTLGLNVRVTGTVSNPSIELDASSLASSVEQAMRNQAQRAAQALAQRSEEATRAAREQVRAQADQLIRQAEQRATAIREEAQQLASRVRLDGYAEADSLVARASSPLAVVGARLAADRLRKETDRRANQIVQVGGLACR
jgi:hypothetical protein